MNDYPPDMIPPTDVKSVIRIPEFVRFVAVLMLGAVIDFGVLNILLLLLPRATFGDLIVVIASAGGFICGLSANFLLHRYWTFRETERKPIRQQLPVFVFISLSALVLRLILVAVLYPLIRESLGGVADLVVQQTLGANIAQFLAMGVSMFWNYYANRRWTYQARGRRFKSLIR